MKIQLHEYFQKSLPKHISIDTTLAPLLNTVKQRNINSIHQLMTNLRPRLHLEQHLLSPTLQSNIPVFPKKGDFDLKEQSFCYSQQLPASLKLKLKSTINSQNKTSKSNKAKSDANPQKKIISTNPRSKIKKHLVENIDYLDIKRAMYQKSNRTNKYQQFFQNLALRNTKTIAHRAKTVAKNTRTVKLMQTEQAIACGQLKQCAYSPDDNIFRITQRRKFWNTSREQSRRKGLNTLLQVNCLSKTFCIQ